MGFSQSLGNFISPLLTGLNAINVLKDERFVNAEEFNYRRNKQRVSVAVGDEDVYALAGHRNAFKTL
jgi:hypothetical protein